MTNAVYWDYLNYEDSGEGGLYAYAFFLANDNDYECVEASNTISLPGPDALVNGHDFYATRLDNNWWEESAGEQVLAAIYLGSTSSSLLNQNGYFEVTEAHLDNRMLQALNLLKIVYERDFKIITYLDT